MLSAAMSPIATADQHENRVPFVSGSIMLMSLTLAVRLLHEGESV